VIVTYESYRMVFNRVKDFFIGGADDDPPGAEAPLPLAADQVDETEALMPYGVFGSVLPWEYLTG